jgi:hypothetical protein
MPRLIHAPFCPHSRFIRLVMAEMGMEAELTTEQIWERRTEFLAMNPAGTTPVLIEEGTLVVPEADIIAEYLDVSYLMVLIYATIPTILYYLSCWLMTEADTRRLDIKPVKTSDASLWELTKSQGYHFLSLGAIAVFLALGFSSFMAVFWSIAIAFTLSMVREDSRLVTIRAYLVGLGFGIVTWVFGQTSVPLSLGLHELFDGRSSVSACWAMAANDTSPMAASPCVWSVAW